MLLSAMLFPFRRALRIGALVLAAVVAATLLYTVYAYRSINIFTPPERLESLGRTYLLGGLPPLSRDVLDQRYPPGHLDHFRLERVGFLPPGHPVYQWQNDEVRGQATTSAYLRWGTRYISYSLSGAP